MQTSRLKKATLFRTISNALQVEISVVMFKPTVEKLHSSFIQNITLVFLVLASLKMSVIKTVPEHGLVDAFNLFLCFIDVTVVIMRDLCRSMFVADSLFYQNVFLSFHISPRLSR